MKEKACERRLAIITASHYTHRTHILFTRTGSGESASALHQEAALLEPAAREPSAAESSTKAAAASERVPAKPTTKRVPLLLLLHRVRVVDVLAVVVPSA